MSRLTASASILLLTAACSSSGTVPKPKGRLPTANEQIAIGEIERAVKSKLLFADGYTYTRFYAFDGGFDTRRSYPSYVYGEWVSTLADPSGDGVARVEDVSELPHIVDGGNHLVHISYDLATHKLTEAEFGGN